MITGVATRIVVSEIIVRVVLRLSVTVTPINASLAVVSHTDCAVIICLIQAVCTAQAGIRMPLNLDVTCQQCNLRTHSGCISLGQDGVNAFGQLERSFPATFDDHFINNCNLRICPRERRGCDVDLMEKDRMQTKRSMSKYISSQPSI